MSSESPKHRVLVFAHVPPPHHGQSVMVALMLRGLASDPAFRVFHVDARVSEDLEDVGGLRIGKLARLLRHCFQALLVRLRHGPMDLYYVPAPAKKAAVLRDWIVMILLRPWFSRTIFHWHATGLGQWACSGTATGESTRRVFPAPLDRPSRLLTRRLMGCADLSIILTEAERKEVSLLQPKRIAVVPNGIPDPCPNFQEVLLPLRQQGEGNAPYRCLYLAHCTREKGLFDTVEAVRLANDLMASRGNVRRISLTVAGSFMNEGEQREFHALLERMPEALVRYAGFVTGAEKSALLGEHDCLVSFSRSETFGLNVVEALAFGMLPCLSPIPAYVESFSEVAVISRGMSVPDLAEALARSALTVPRPEILRDRFLMSFTGEKFVERITEALKEV